MPRYVVNGVSYDNAMDAEDACYVNGVKVYTVSISYSTSDNIESSYEKQKAYREKIFGR